MGRRAKTDDERMEEWIATAKPESLQRLYDLIGFSIRREKLLADKRAPKEKAAKDPDPAQPTLPGVKP